MTYGFTFKGRHCTQLGVRLLRYTVNSPDLREFEDEPAGLPGVLDFGSELGKREIEITVDIIAGAKEFKRQQSEILSWLKPTTGAGMIVFDDMPDRFYYAKFTGKLTPEQIGRYGEFRFTMKCTDPFAYSTVESSDINVDSSLPVDTEISIDAEYTFAVTGAGGDYLVDNFGYEPVSPVITVSGSFASFAIVVGGVEISVLSPYSGTLTIDYARMRVTSNGVSVGYGGDFGELPPGQSTIRVTGTNVNASVSVRFRAKYL